MSTRRGRALARVLVLVTLLGAGIAGYAPSTASAAPGVDADWQHEADRTVDMIQGLGGLDGLARSTAAEVRDLRRSVDDLIGRAPRAELRTARDDALLRRLSTAHAYEALVDVVDVSRVSFASDAAEVAVAATVDQRVRARLTENGEEILHDAACETAYRLMTPVETVEADEVSRRPYVRDLDAGPDADSIVRYGQRSVSGFFGHDAVRLVDWNRYGDGMAEQIDAYVARLGGTVENPDPTSMFVHRTTASVHYARTCLLPPR